MLDDDSYFDLGGYHRPVDTDSLAARRWFDRGMVWAYGFNHDEAVWCFDQALALDPTLSLARWAIAYAVGPNYNRAWESFDTEGRAAALERALAELTLAAEHGGRTVEKGLIAALSARFPTDDAEDLETLETGHAAYADAMLELALEHPDDVDVQTLAADALINLTVWKLWDVNTGEPAPGSRVVEARRLMESALGTPTGRRHPGLLHFYLHAMEMSGTPEAALPAADWLRGLVPGSGHLQHMPSHIDVLCGDYRNAVIANKIAVEADRAFVHRRGAANTYSRYRAHNLHFVVYAAMFQGSYQTAIEAADELSRQLTPELLSDPSLPMADWLEAFTPIRVHVLIRFGRWAELIDEPLPEDTDLYCTTAATILYGRGVALAATGRVSEARAVREEFEAARRRIPTSRSLFKVRSLDTMAIAAAMLDGEIAYREGDYDVAFHHLRRAVELDDTLPYDEPWGWMQPARHALGALLLEQDRVEEAARVYAADLGLDETLGRSCQHPSNVWSLHGYHECLLRLGRDDEATIIGNQLALAAARADVNVRASCACRLETPEPCCNADERVAIARNG
jgi:tetratricopeptide (TPR) repeat protein